MLNKIIKSTMFVSLTLFLFSAINQIALAQAKCTKFGKEVPCEELKGLLGWGLGIIALFIIGGIVALVFWILMLVHAATKPIDNKEMWMILMVFTGIVGAFIYYFVVKRKFNA